MLVPELFDVAFDHFFDFDGIYFATLGVTNLIWKHLTEISSRYKKTMQRRTDDTLGTHFLRISL